MIKVIECEQNSPEWHAARLGVPTASQMSTIMAKGRAGGEGETRKKYLHQLAAEIITGQPTDSYSNAAMQRGHDQEPEARHLYELTSDADVVQIGFVRRGRFGASPDSLVGHDGLLEIKSKAAHLMIAIAERDTPPPEHIKQVQAQMWATGRDWCDLSCYCPGFPLLTHRIKRDPDLHAEMEEAIAAFITDLDAIVARVLQRLGMETPK
jgi:hypothetical protein